MAQNLRLLGWCDAEHPATPRDGGLHDFRLRLSEVPLSPWKRLFTDLGREQKPLASIEQDVLTLTCELPDVQQAVERLKLRMRGANDTLARQERDTNDRVAREMLDSEARRAAVLAAVRDIRFDQA